MVTVLDEYEGLLNRKKDLNYSTVLNFLRLIYTSSMKLHSYAVRRKCLLYNFCLFIYLVILFS